MKNPTMIYKAPGPHEIHGGRFDYRIVDADEEGELEQAVADGWHLTTTAAIGEKAVTTPDAAPTPAVQPKATPSQAKAKSAPAQPWAKE